MIESSHGRLARLRESNGANNGRASRPWLDERHVLFIRIGDDL
jgi:hypothetical protein